jgi:glycosyltransferase involved in cell wall biosynthesis
MELQSKARISIGLSISDGISTSLLEAMAMGSFPIQSYTACANEWIEDQISGFIVPPEDPEIIEQAIRKALADDNLVDSAAEANYLTIAQKADYKILQQTTIDTYSKILNSNYETSHAN